jgi:hypothetical protein
MDRYVYRRRSARVRISGMQELIWAYWTIIHGFQYKHYHTAAAGQVVDTFNTYRSEQIKQLFKVYPPLTQKNML